jgi:hypothetical protein
MVFYILIFTFLENMLKEDERRRNLTMDMDRMADVTTPKHIPQYKRKRRTRPKKTLGRWDDYVKYEQT